MSKFSIRRRHLLKTSAALGVGGVAAIASATNATAANQNHTTPTVFDFGAQGDGSSDDSGAFAAALSVAAQQGQMILVPAGTYVIKNPIGWSSKGNVGAPWGFIGQGATLVSQIRNGEDVMYLTSNDTVRYFQISGALKIVGSGADGSGLHIVAPSSRVFFYNALIDGLSIERVGGHGLLFEGDVFESTIANSYFQDCGGNGATFATSKGGVVSAINVIGCFFNQNSQCGLAATNFDGQYGGATDIRVIGGYCRDNQSYGFYYNNGTGGATIEQVGFENNCRALSPGDPSGAHVYGMTSMQLRSCTGYNEAGGATYLLRGWFSDLVYLDGCGQAAGGAMASTGKSRLVQVDGGSNGHVFMLGCSGGVDVTSGTACTWEAQGCTGPSPLGALSLRATLAKLN